ncbi:hypothetical protein CBLAS_1292 [Campylobacter blaseri]|uniref:Uncharacterized protein n=1 Tax=Campylobacter blaseri TaxID=2042961 RepID=A0A2P8QY92_9BACT|nr:ankyrin repeat domain-containing protein [Campylobacter blaseri]PSM51226.1 hypothetical protein CQ405_09215 [Campylobacter blaseri]PSM52375.1 hypothetical protein CRN67_09195 [Campylobacter blaseri]QKF86464.1 hypothetical protein CBLAS_1292 [Campylobacter blaseri]
MKQILTLIFVLFIFTNLTFANDVNKSLNNEQTLLDKNQNLINKKIQLMDNFFLAIQNLDKKEVQSFLLKDKKIINTQHNGFRAVDVCLFNDNFDIEMLKLLLAHKPQLDYLIPSFKNMSPLQMIATADNLKDGILLAKLLVDSGANVDFKDSNGDGSSSALIFSYISDNYEFFKFLIEKGANLKLTNENNKDIIDYMLSNYLNEIIKYHPNIKLSFENKIPQDIFQITTKDSYRLISDANLKYLKTIFRTKSLQDLNQNIIATLAKYYALTNEISGLELLLKQGLCDNNKLCYKLNQIAILNSNVAVINLLNKRIN